MDFVNPHRQAPITGQVLPRMNYDLGAILTVVGQGAGTILSSQSSQRKLNEVNTSSRGVRVDVSIANKVGTIDVVVTIRRFIKGLNAYVNLLSSVSLTANGTTTYVVHPDYTTAANTIAKEHIGEEWDVQVVCGVGVTPAADITVNACMLS